MRRRSAILLRVYVGVMCVWLLAPIVIVVILAFSGDGYLRFPPGSLSLQWFGRFFGDVQWRRALLLSLVIGAIACVVSTTIGFFEPTRFFESSSAARSCCCP
jgi:putative spermidine/putrescine transport system permease protein